MEFVRCGVNNESTQNRHGYTRVESARRHTAKEFSWCSVNKMCGYGHKTE